MPVSDPYELPPNAEKLRSALAVIKTKLNEVENERDTLRQRVIQLEIQLGQLQLQARIRHAELTNPTPPEPRAGIPPSAGSWGFIPPSWG